MVELLVVAVVLAIAVDILANGIASKLTFLQQIGLGAFLAAAVLLIAVLRIVPRSHTEVFDGFVLLDSEARRLMSVPRYELADRTADLLSAAFAENPALASQWLYDGTPTLKDAGSVTLLNEALEYFVLSELSTHLTDHFAQTLNTESHDLQTLGRTDLSSHVLSNRLLELFSRPMADRQAFRKSDRQPVRPESRVVAAFGSEGALFEEFELVLPRHATVSRTDDGTLNVSSPIVDIQIACRYDGCNEFVPFEFLEHYLNSGPYTLHPLSVTTNVSVAIRWRGLLSRRAWRYYAWADSFTAALEVRTSADAFFDRISWPTIEALIRAIQPPPSVRNRSERSPSPPHS